MRGYFDYIIVLKFDTLVQSLDRVIYFIIDKLFKICQKFGKNKLEKWKEKYFKSNILNKFIKCRL